MHCCLGVGPNEYIQKGNQNCGTSSSKYPVSKFFLNFRRETVRANLQLGSKFIYNKKSIIFAQLSWKSVKISNSWVHNNAWISAWLHQKWGFLWVTCFKAQSQICSLLVQSLLCICFLIVWNILATMNYLKRRKVFFLKRNCKYYI